MKTRIKTHLVYLILFVLLTNCASQRTSMLVGVEYNEIKDETDYIVIPYGSVTVPGKWRKTNYNTVSRQQFFQNSDSLIIAIAFSRFDKYEFNIDGENKGLDFVKAYYEWDSKYFVDEHRLRRKEMKIDNANGFMTYRVFGQIEKEEFDTYFLIGEKNGIITNISISNTDKWTESKKLTFMENLFISKKK